MSTQTEQARESFTLDDQSASEIERLSDETGLPPEELMGIALRMLIIAVDGKKHGHKVLLTSKAGYPIRELVVPDLR